MFKSVLHWWQKIDMELAADYAVSVAIMAVIAMIIIFLVRTADKVVAKPSIDSRLVTDDIGPELRRATNQALGR